VAVGFKIAAHVFVHGTGVGYTNVEGVILVEGRPQVTAIPAEMSRDGYVGAVVLHP
jgi:hypothetical protein